MTAGHGLGGHLPTPRVSNTSGGGNLPLGQHSEGVVEFCGIGHASGLPSTGITVTFTLEQYAQVKKLFQSNTSGPSANVAGIISAFVASRYTDDWIVDTGATNYIVCNPRVLTTITKNNTTWDDGIHLPNGSTILILHIDNCSLGQEESPMSCVLPTLK